MFKQEVEDRYEIKAGDLIKFPKVHPSERKALDYDDDPRIYKHRGYGPTSMETEMWLSDIAKLKGSAQKKAIRSLLDSIQDNEGSNERYVMNKLAAIRYG